MVDSAFHTVIQVCTCGDLTDEREGLNMAVRTLHDVCCADEAQYIQTRLFLTTWLRERELLDEGGTWVQPADAVDEVLGPLAPKFGVRPADVRRHVVDACLHFMDDQYTMLEVGCIGCTPVCCGTRRHDQLLRIVSIIRKYVKHSTGTRVAQRIYVAAVGVEQELRPTVNHNWWLRRAAIMMVVFLFLFGVGATIAGALYGGLRSGAS